MQIFIKIAQHYPLSPEYWMIYPNFALRFSNFIFFLYLCPDYTYSISVIF